MHWARAAMVGLLAVTAACTAKGGTSSGGAGPPIGSADLPVVKAGYWERTVTPAGGAPQVSHVCDAGEPLKLDGVDRNCSNFTMTRNAAGGIDVNATCASGPVAASLHETFSGDFTASYASDSQLTLTLQGQPPRTLTTHVAMRYVGACPPQPPPTGPSDAG
jgi:hypothetical protein